MSTEPNLNNIMECLYDISRAGVEAASTDEFLARAAASIPMAVPSAEVTGARIIFRGRAFTSPDFRESDSIIAEYIVIEGKKESLIEIHYQGDNPCSNMPGYLMKFLASIIGSAIRQLELDLLLHSYNERFETEITNRTRELENVQAKLIRSERLAAVGELASGVGHELRNPLNVIRNCAYLLKTYLTDKEDKEALDALDTLDKQVDIANKIVTDLMDFTRVNPASPQRIDLHFLIGESLSNVTIPDNIIVKSLLNGDSPRLRTDPEQIGRVFINIITNACQAMNEEGELVIESGSGDSLAWVSFRDTGCGILPENIGKIFEPLFTTKPKGIGLGLSISKRLVEQNGGKIEVASETGKGTTFKIILPLDKRGGN